MRHPRRVVRFFIEGALACFPHALRDEIHRVIEIHVHPVARSRGAILHLRRARGMAYEFVARRTFRAKVSARNRRRGIAFDADDFAVAVKDELAATYRAVRTDRSRDLRMLVPR